MHKGITFEGFHAGDRFTTGRRTITEHDIMQFVGLVGLTEPLFLEASHFLECIRTGRQPDTSPRSGVEVVRVIHAAEQSLRHGGAPQSVY